MVKAQGLQPLGFAVGVCLMWVKASTVSVAHISHEVICQSFPSPYPCALCFVCNDVPQGILQMPSIDNRCEFSPFGPQLLFPAMVAQLVPCMSLSRADPVLGLG